MVGFSPSMMGDPISLIGKDVGPRALPRGQWEIPNFFSPKKVGIYGVYIYDFQESLENTINTMGYHGYTVRDIPNSPYHMEIMGV